MLRKLKCFFGFHAPDVIREENFTEIGRNGAANKNFYVARCLYCDRVVVRIENQNQRIRRVK